MKNNNKTISKVVVVIMIVIYVSRNNYNDKNQGEICSCQGRIKKLITLSVKKKSKYIIKLMYLFIEINFDALSM